MIHNECFPCLMCNGKRYVPVYVKRSDSFYDRVWTECDGCHGKGFVENKWSDTPLLDYVKGQMTPESVGTAVVNNLRERGLMQNDTTKD